MKITLPASEVTARHCFPVKFHKKHNLKIPHFKFHIFPTFRIHFTDAFHALKNILNVPKRQIVLKFFLSKQALLTPPIPGVGKAYRQLVQLTP